MEALERQVVVPTLLGLPELSGDLGVSLAEEAPVLSSASNCGQRQRCLPAAILS